MRCALGRGPTRLDLARASARLKELVGSRLRSGRDHPSTGSSSLVRQEMDGTKFCWFLGNRAHRGRTGTSPASLPSLQTSALDPSLTIHGSSPRIRHRRDPSPTPDSPRRRRERKTTTGQSCLQKGRTLQSVRVGVGTNLRIMTESESLAISASTSSKPSFLYKL